MANAATVAGWAGVLAGLAGIIASGYLVRAGKRNDKAENALAVARDMADIAAQAQPAADAGTKPGQNKKVGKDQQPDRDFQPVIVDLNREIVANDKANRTDTRTGAWLLGAAFVLLIIQSIALITAGTGG